MIWTCSPSSASSWAARATGRQCAAPPTLWTNWAIAYEKRIVSAHRTPERLYTYAKEAEGRGFKVIIAGAGGAAHLPGMAASLTCLPVLGVPIKSRALSGLDSLLSIVQMPSGIPVGTLAIGDSGAFNAGLWRRRSWRLPMPPSRRACGNGGRRTHPTVAEEPADAAAERLPRGSVIGIVGGGQLGRMLAQAAAKLGFKASIFSPEADSPAFDVAAFRHCAAYDDADGAGANSRPRRTSSPSSSRTSRRTRWPSSNAGARCRRPGARWKSSQNRIAERRFLASLGLPVAPWAEVANRCGGLGRAYTALAAEAPGVAAYLKRALSWL